MNQRSSCHSLLFNVYYHGVSCVVCMVYPKSFYSEWMSTSHCSRDLYYKFLDVATFGIILNWNFSLENGGDEVDQVSTVLTSVPLQYFLTVLAVRKTVKLPERLSSHETLLCFKTPLQFFGQMSTEWVTVICDLSEYEE